MGWEEDAMLRELGLPNVEALFDDIPEKVRVKGLPIPAGRGEQDVVHHITAILRKNRGGDVMPTFLGGGLYDHFVPASVRAITSRSEFYTAYTPYQAELSQGILQALFEYQSLIAELTGLDVANTSMYDGSTALGEAALMAHRLNGRKEILVPRSMHWERRQVLTSYLHGAGMRIRDIPWEEKTGLLNLSALRLGVTPDTAAVYFENPGFFGPFEDRVDEIRAAAGEALLIVGANPLALAVTKAPGDYGADIVVGEGQPLGNAVNFGGPLLGIFACRAEHVRKAPGRIIGLTKDAKGHRAFCMTLVTREQHIRREKAMSNICTNQTLMAVAAVAYAAVLGGNGLRRVAAENVHRARRLMAAINRVPGFAAPLFDGYHFNEFVVRSTRDYGEISRSLLDQGVHGGLSLTKAFPELGQSALFATTEVHTDEDQDRLVKALEALTR